MEQRIFVLMSNDGMFFLQYHFGGFDITEIRTYKSESTAKKALSQLISKTNKSIAIDESYGATVSERILNLRDKLNTTKIVELDIAATLR